MDIQKIKELTKHYLSQEKSGHDWLHIQRVVTNCEQIIKQIQEPINIQVVLAAAYTHDLLDDKLKAEHLLKEEDLRHLLEQAKVPQKEVEQVLTIIKKLSFSANLIEKQTLTLEGQIVQDADRLDAMGAIGIARTFYYGGSKGHILYDPKADSTASPSILSKESYRQVRNVRQHFNDKLLKLKSLMNTKAGQKMAENRHQLMVDFLQAFDQETLLNIEQSS
ncbi:HD domain-containing protein [Facklamia sp. 7083-14-GEN3]|uniref:HD domain-containing protein n=1 Tax=Facklamia sp. 7083-14-GEN3 TaxID=2973478 RepID=UPI00215D5976|nr:HD domain-containing protein [Facklamia sp. 7083-14-GEN3]MCR8968862.1 HD domain-containing protein [Facklamia sp. 7083-14-GEN3]